MSTSTAQLDEKSWIEIARVLPHVLPPIIDALTKGQGGGAKSSTVSPSWPTFDKSPGEDPQKFLNILIPILTSVLPAVVDAVTKGFGGSLGGGFSSPLGNLSVGGTVQLGKSTTPQVDEKIWGDILRLVLPPIIGAVTKGRQPERIESGDNEKFLNLLPFILPPLISALSR